MDENSNNNPFDENAQKASQPSYYSAGMSPVEEDTSSRTLVWLMLGVAAIGCGLLFAAGLFFYRAEAQSLYNEYFPSPTATKTNTPRPTATQTATPMNTFTPTVTMTRTPTLTSTIPFVLVSPSGNESIFTDAFESNANTWQRYYGNNTAEVKDGKLIINADEAGYVGAAECRGCPSFSEAFYFQAEVTTAIDTFASHGLLFCAHSDRSLGYYTFEVDTQGQYYVLRKNTVSGWTTLVQMKRSTVINKFPSSNTLAVRYTHGKIDMYINGKFMDTYTPADPFECNDIGFIVQEGQIDLIVDNVFAYKVIDPASSTPSP